MPPDYLSLLPSYTRSLPRFCALFSAVLRQAEDLQRIIPAVNAAFSLASAAGDALSALGASLGIPRPPEATDEVYRTILIARCALRRWDGTNEDVQPVLSSVFPDARFSDHGDLSVFAGSATAAALPVPMKTLFPVPAGVKCLTSG